MKDIVVLGFADEPAADDFMDTVEAMEADDVLGVVDIVKVTVDEHGKRKIHQGASVVKGGAVVGGLLGGIVGLAFLSPVAGAAIGAAGGAAIGKLSGDQGIDDDFVKETAAALTPGSAAVFLMIDKRMPDKVEAQIQGLQATVISTTLNEDSEARLRAALQGGRE